MSTVASRSKAGEYLDAESIARFARSAPERESVKKQIELGKGPAQIDTQQRVELRMENLGLDREKAAAAAHEVKSASGGRELLRGTTLGLQRIIAERDFVSVTFLERGFRVSRAVGCIRDEDGTRIGSGFLVGPRLLLTNAHVIRSLEEAEEYSVEFDFEDSLDGSSRPSVVFKLDPEDCFISSEEDKLDYTLVAVAETSGGKRLKDYGFLPLNPALGKVLRGECLNIIQHPNGRPKEVALRANRFTALLPDFVHYETDTEPGSSGSPVFNDQWEVICLHHSGVPATNSEGEILTKDGRVWRDGIDHPRLISWIGNEGIRVSRIVADIDRQAGENRPEILSRFPRPAERASADDRRVSPDADVARPARRQVKVLQSIRPTITPPRLKRSAALQTDKADKRQTSSPAHDVVLSAQAPNVNVEIPLRISVSLGAAQNVNLVHAPPADAAPNGDSNGSVDGTASVETLVERGLKMLERSQTRTYFDEEKDEADRERYYRDIDPESETLFDDLHELVVSTHTTQLSYRVARIEYLYAWVDLQRSKKVRSIYSDLKFNPENFIEEDFVLERRIDALVEKRQAREGIVTPQQLERLRAELEAQEPFNCEHVVPQSWFDKFAPMQGDLHHLYTCEGNCNSFRGNRPYADFGQFEIVEEAVRPKCGFSENGLFEPFMGKGKVARATLYFMLRYPDEFNNMYDELEEGLETLLRWHEATAEDISEHERHRNQAIFEIQGNRNPFIDHPSWARAAFA